MGTGKPGRVRRVIYQWKFKREQHDNKAINAMIERAETITDGRADEKARFLKVADITTDPISHDRPNPPARRPGGLRHQSAASKMDGAAVITANHDLWKMEQSFRTAKGDLRARPVLHHQREAIDAHLAVVFAPWPRPVTFRTAPPLASRRSSIPCAP
jgi:hypothetical protein